MFKALLILCVTSTGIFAMSKDSSIARCEANINLLKSTARKFRLAEVESFFPKLLSRLDEILAKLKIAKVAKDIVDLRKSCDSGFDAGRFVLETFEHSEVKSPESSTPHEQVHASTHNNASKPNAAPAA